MATYAIGDVQGCDEELGELLKTIRFNADRDRLWFAGDIVNRGPQSLAALRRVYAMRDNIVTVLGNHDLHLLAVASAPAGALQARRPKSGDTLDDILGAPDRDRLLDWLQTRPLFHHDPALAYALLHAGLPPQWNLAEAQSAAREAETALKENAAGVLAHMYGDQPDRWSDDLQGYDRIRFIINCFTRMRYCDAEGKINPKLKGGLDRDTAPYLPWFRVPERRSRNLRIVCGHWSALGLHFENNVFAIDSGCVWGGQLSALRLDETAQPISVSCQGYRDIES